MKVLFLSVNDWANYGYMLSQCMRSVGVESVSIAKTKHRFNYPLMSLKIKDPELIKNYVNDYDIIVYLHSRFFETGVSLNNKRVFVFHGGGAYRHHSKDVNEVFNPIIEGSIIQTEDLLGLGAKNEHWVLPAVDVKLLKPKYSRINGKQVVFAHYPTSKSIKGTDIVFNVISSLSKDNTISKRLAFEYSCLSSVWKEQIERINRCDVYLDQFVLGAWGMTSLEAAALGKIVVTNFVGKEMYEKEYGECGLLVANNWSELNAVLDHLLRIGDEQLLDLKMKSRKWVESLHNYKAIGNRLRRIFRI